MQSIISEIFDGEKYRTENIIRSDNYKLMQKSLDIDYQKFFKTLTEKQKDLFEEVYNGLSGLEAEQSKTSFEEGFKLGLSLAFEIIKE